MARKPPLYPHIPKSRKNAPEWQWDGNLEIGKLHGYKIDGGYLYQIWEQWRDKNHTELGGELRVYEESEWSQQEQKNWELIMSVGRLYYRIYLLTNTARITDLFIIDRLQKMGFGSKLLEIAEERFRHYGVKSVGGSAVVEARDYWRKKGYTVTDGEMLKVLS